MAAKTSEWRPGPTVCRCCLSEGCYKDISTEYFWMGKREVYAEMLADTFDLAISFSKSGGPNSQSRLICEPCIARLRDSYDFKRQVQECEKTFVQCLDPVNALTDLQVSLDLDKDVKIEVVKEEKGHSGDDDEYDDAPDFGDDDDEYDDLDDQPLTKLASKMPKKEEMDVLDLLDNAKITEKRKSSSKIKGQPSKKSKSIKTIATSSKEKPEPKKKKDMNQSVEYKPRPVSHIQMAKRNAELVLKYSTVYPFRVRGKYMLCVYCCEEFEEPSDFRSHMDETHQSFTVSTAFAHCAKGKDYLKVDLTNLKCRICFMPCNNLDEVAMHLFDVHGMSQMNRKYDIGMHPYRMDTEKWICFLCDKKFPTLTKLARHTTGHYLKYTCEECGRMYLSNEALKYHKRCNHSGTYACRKCWIDFPTLEMRKEHVKLSKSCWKFCCTECSERFLSWESKQKHLVEVHGRERVVYDCPDCDMSFYARKRFYNHYTLNHSDDNYVCSCCGHKFGTKKEMEEHRSGHSGEKPYRCEVCRKDFSRSKSLKQHMWLHSETKRFICVICEKQFAQKVSLISHMKVHHPDIPFKI